MTYRRLVDAVKDYAIFMLDPTGHVMSWNPGAERIKGYAAGEIIGRHFSVFYPKGAIDSHYPEHELKVAAETGRFEDEGIRLRKDGSPFFANIVISAVRDDDGRLIGYTKVTRDITERKQAEDKLKRLNEELEQRVKERTEELEHRRQELVLITDALPTALAYVGSDQHIQFVNSAYAAWRGAPKDAIVGKSVREIAGAEDYATLRSFIEDGLAGRRRTAELEMSFPDRRRTVTLTAIPDVAPDGSVRGYTSILNDITAQRTAEKELRQAKEAAEAASRAKSAFLANMSHEIRTPLGAVLGFADLLVSLEQTSSERQNCAEAIKRNGVLLGQIINDILDLSRVEAGRLEIERIAVATADIVSDLSSLLALQASEKGITLTIAAEGPVPELIRTDPLRLKQVLMNIIGNAIKFTDKGGVYVTIKPLPDKDGKIALAFLVRDTGAGVAPEHRTRIFEPFTQADASTTRRFGGSGLGLPLSRRLAHRLGGDVELMQSEVGRGSTFRVTIDPGSVTKVLFEGGSPAKGLPAEPLIAVPARADLEGVHVLLAEDALDNQHLVSRYLKVAGATVDCAGNGQEALDKVAGGNFDVILMDLQMPIMDGYEATAELRRRGFPGPIIAMTAHAMKEERERCLRAGFDEHVSKPIDRRLLQQRIATLLAARQAAAKRRTR